VATSTTSIHLLLQACASPQQGEVHLFLSIFWSNAYSAEVQATAVVFPTEMYHCKGLRLDHTQVNRHHDFRNLIRAFAGVVTQSASHEVW